MRTRDEEITRCLTSADCERKVRYHHLVCVETFPSPGPTPQVFYLLGVRENRPDELAAQVEAQHGMRAELIAERRAQNERLFVMRFSRSQPASA